MPTTTPSVPPAVLDEARRLVDQEPGIEAVVLFGSRARGDHHPGSDYDLAIVGHARPGATDALAAAHPQVELIRERDRTELRERANLATSLEASIVRQGVVIAGRWRRPPHRKENLDVATRDLAQHLRSASRNLSTATQLASDGLRDGALADLDATTAAFDAAERTGKALVWTYGETPRAVHDVTVLAEQLERGTATGHEAAERRSLARRLRALDGLSPQGHQATYGTGVFEITERTADRIVRTAALHGATLKRAAAHHHPGEATHDLERARHLTNLHDAAMEGVKCAARVLEKPTPEPLRHAMLCWLHDAAGAARTVARRIDAVPIEKPQALARTAERTEDELRTLAARHLGTDPGKPPPHAAPATTPGAARAAHALDRLADTVINAPTATRFCLDPDPSATTGASLPSWDDLKAAARVFRDAGPGPTRPGEAHLIALSARLTGEAASGEPDHARAADELEYRSRITAATAAARALHERAGLVLKADPPRTDATTAAVVHDLTRPAAAIVSGPHPLPTREDTLTRIGHPLKAGRRAHVAHVIDLLPDLGWRLERIEHGLGLAPGPDQSRGSPDA